MARGRPAGMYKDDQGLWHYADGTLTPSSAAKVNGGTDTLTPPAIKPVKPAQTATWVSAKNKPYGAWTHTFEEVESLEQKTGLVYVGDITDDHNIRIPVLMSPDRNQDWRIEHLTKLEKGI